MMNRIHVPKELLLDSPIPLERLLAQSMQREYEDMLFSGCIASGQITTMVCCTGSYKPTPEPTDDGMMEMRDGVMCRYDWATAKWIPIGADKPLFQYP